MRIYERISFKHFGLLRKFGTDDSQAKLIPSAAKKDLYVWKNCVREASAGFPLGEIFENPPIFPVSFVTDAAGAAWEVTENGRVNCSVPNDRGAAAVGHCKGKVTAVARVIWPKISYYPPRVPKGNFTVPKVPHLKRSVCFYPFSLSRRIWRGGMSYWRLTISV